jgi:hypothetical protein
MRFLLVTKSSRVAPAQLEAMAAAFNLAQAPFSRAWGIASLHAAPLSIHHPPNPEDVIADFVDADEGDGTLAWHAERKGNPTIQVDVSAVLRYGGNILTDFGTGLSVSGSFQHEAYETAIDRFANAYVQRADGSWIALEVGDPVEAFSIYTDLPNLGPVHGSDAVLPHYFCEDAPPGSALSLSGQCGEPFENDGYQITIPAGGAVADREIVIAHEKYTGNKLAYRKARIESGRGRGVSRIEV